MGEEMEDVLYRREGAVEIVTLNRPDKLNALNFLMVQSIADRMERLSQDDGARAVVLTGEGKAFCSGADISGPGGRDDAATPPGMRITAQEYNRMITAMCNLEKPIIGAINGDAAGGGCNFAFACDLLVAAEEARFIEVFVRRGLVADCGGTHFLPRMIGLNRAKWYMFTGEPITAGAGLEMGLVCRVVSGEGLMDEAMELAGLLADGPTRAIGMIKNMLNKSFDSDLSTSLDREATLQGIAVGTEDVAEGIMAFLQKRKPEFKGR